MPLSFLQKRFKSESGRLVVAAASREFRSSLAISVLTDSAESLGQSHMSEMRAPAISESALQALTRSLRLNSTVS